MFTYSKGEIWVRLGEDWINAGCIEIIERHPNGSKVYTRSGRVLESDKEPYEIVQTITQAAGE